jgi:uncharacterized C2H2 Zn-finger protein
MSARDSYRILQEEEVLRCLFCNKWIDSTRTSQARFCNKNCGVKFRRKEVEKRMREEINKLCLGIEEENS